MLQCFFAFLSVNHFCPQDVPFPSSPHPGELGILVQWHITVLTFHSSSSTSCLLEKKKTAIDLYLNCKYWAKWHQLLVQLLHWIQWSLTFKMNGDCSTMKPLDIQRVRFDKDLTVPELHPLTFLCLNNSEVAVQRHWLTWNPKAKIQSEIWFSPPQVKYGSDWDYKPDIICKSPYLW